MRVQMKSFYFHSEHEINKTLKYYNVNYIESAFVFKAKDICIPSDFGQSNKDVLCGIAYVNPFKIQCNSCFTFINKHKVLCGIVFDHVENEEGVNLSSLIHNLCRNDRIIVLNGVFTNIFGVDHLIIRPRENKIAVFHFKFTTNPSYLNTVGDIYLKLSDKDIYSVFGRVICVKKDSIKDDIHLILECYNFQSIKLHISYSENFSQEEMLSLVRCNCFFDFIDVTVNEPSIDFTLLVPDQQILLYNVKATRLNFFGMYSLYTNGETENLCVISQNSILPDQDQNITPNVLKSESLFEANGYQNIYSTTLVQRENPTPNELIPEIEILSEVDQNQEKSTSLELNVLFGLNSSSA